MRESSPHLLNRPSLVVAALLVIHASVAAWNLGGESLWVDEACSALYARSSISEVFQRLQKDCGAPFHYLLLKGIRMIAGEKERSLRAPSVFFSVLTAFLIWRLGRRLADEWAGVYGVIMWIALPITLRMAREARCYTLLACLTIALVLVWLRWLDTPRPLNLIAPLLLHVTAAYTHNFGIFLIPAAALMLFPVKGKYAVAPFAGVIGAFLLLYLPWLPILYLQMGMTERAIGWVTRAWSPLSPIRSLALFCFGAFRPVYSGLPAVPVIVPAIGIGSMLWPASLLVRRWRDHSHLASVFFFSVGYLLAPYLFSLVVRPIDLPGRTDFPVFPLLCVMMGCGVTRLGRWLWLWLGVVLLLATIWSNAILFPGRGYSDRELADQVDRWVEVGDVVVCTGLSPPGMEYYLHQGVKEGPKVISFPPEVGTLGYLEEAVYLRDSSLLSQQYEELIRLVWENTPSQRGRVLVVLTPRRINRELIARLTQARFGTPRDLPGGRLGLSRIGEPCRLVLFERTAGGP